MGNFWHRQNQTNFDELSISNSYKFTSEGGYILRAAITLAIKITQSQETFLNSRYLNVTVSDTGLGISESDKNGLFQVFGTVSKYRDQFNMKGTGLGLTITQKFIKLLGGEIELNSEESKGTEINFTIKEKEMPVDDFRLHFNQRIEESKEPFCSIKSNLKFFLHWKYL